MFLSIALFIRHIVCLSMSLLVFTNPYFFSLYRSGRALVHLMRVFSHISFVVSHSFPLIFDAVRCISIMVVLNSPLLQHWIVGFSTHLLMVSRMSILGMWFHAGVWGLCCVYVVSMVIRIAVYYFSACVCALVLLLHS